LFGYVLEKEKQRVFNPENPTEFAGNSLIWASIIMSVAFGIVDCFLVTDLINYMRNRNKKKEDI